MPVMWVKKRNNRRTVALGHMTLERLDFDFAESPFAITMETLLYGKNVVMEGSIKG